MEITSSNSLIGSKKRRRIKFGFRINNKPSELLKFMSDPANANEAVELGLFEPSEPTKSDTSDTKSAF
jgi:hypothetical protein